MAQLLVCDKLYPPHSDINAMLVQPSTASPISGRFSQHVVAENIEQPSEPALNDMYVGPLYVEDGRSPKGS
jgi:hypothetical protein